MKRLFPLLVTGVLGVPALCCAAPGSLDLGFVGFTDHAVFTLPDGFNDVPAWQKAGDDFILRFTRHPNVSGVSFFAEFSSGLTPGGWMPVPNSSTPPDYEFHASGGFPRRLFLRLRLTAP
jgi:hypothetical protein